jgi:magnesium transporter
MCVVDHDRLDECLANPNGFTWLDFRAVEKVETLDRRTELEHVLQEHFKFHPLAVEDVLIEYSTPKVDDWETYLFVVLHAVKWDKNLKDVDTAELDMFVGVNFLLTYRTEEIPALDKLYAACIRDERHSRRGPDYLLYEIGDFIAAEYAPCMDAMEEELDDLEDAIFNKPSPQTLSRVFKLKSAVLNLRRVLSPQREVMNKLARDDYAVIDANDRIYFRDVYDHFVRLVDLNESLRDIVTGALDTYLSVTANRTNNVMKTLTIFTMLFSPIAAVTGFFGMNFFSDSIVINPPIPAWALFLLAVFTLAAVPAGLLLYIRNRGWW